MTKAPPRSDGLKPWCLSYYFRGGVAREIVYALNAADARRLRAEIPKVHSVRRATVEDVAIEPMLTAAREAQGAAR